MAAGSGGMDRGDATTLAAATLSCGWDPAVGRGHNQKSTIAHRMKPPASCRLQRFHDWTAAGGASFAKWGRLRSGANAGRAAADSCEVYPCSSAWAETK